MKKRTIDAIREEWNMPFFVSDYDIESAATGTFTEARVELSLAIQDAKRAIWKAITNAN